jgi:alkylation response protein AidB-like acyl-CoA dehydrogenase
VLLDCVARRQAILEAGSQAQLQEWLPRIAEGSAKVSLAWTEPNARWDAAGIVATGCETVGGFLLSGTKLFAARCAAAPSGFST